jgi:hypothetical protein
VWAPAGHDINHSDCLISDESSVCAYMNETPTYCTSKASISILVYYLDTSFSMSLCDVVELYALHIVCVMSNHFNGYQTPTTETGTKALLTAACAW